MGASVFQEQEEQSFSFSGAESPIIDFGGFPSAEGGGLDQAFIALGSPPPAGAVSSSDEEEEGLADIPLGCAERLDRDRDGKPLTHPALSSPADCTFTRPSIVPALTLGASLSTKLAELDEAEEQAQAAAAGESVVLEEVIDPSYEPTEADVDAYAASLGLDPVRVQIIRHARIHSVGKSQSCMFQVQEAGLLWIAREGLVAPLPPGWKPCASPDGEVYYFNFDNGESVWDHPGDAHYRQIVEREREKVAAAGA